MKNLAADPVEHSAIKKIAIRLVPFIALMFFINYLDRTAISFDGLYALAFFLPTIIRGFEALYGTKFNLFQQGLIIAIPYLPAAVALYFWSRDATKRGVKTWHIAIPAVVGAITIPIALFMGSPAGTV